MSSSRKLTAFSAGLALLSSGLVAASIAPAQANPAGTGLVISEVYGGGGNSGALYSHDFVELYNPTGAAIDLSGMSIQYRSSTNTGTSGSVSSLASAGSVPAGEHFVVTLASQNTAVGAPVPNVDFAGSASVNMSGSNGQVYLAASPSGIDPDGAGNTTITDPAVVDFVGYGTAVIKEGATAAPSPSGNSTSITRDAANADTDVNGDDFFVASPTAGESYAPPPPPAVTEATIPEIQGTGEASSMDGDTVVTEGVVTAAYPSGLFGFYLQTPGSGGALDLGTHTASDGLFVYYPFGAGAVTVQPGDHVQVTGEVDEFAGATQLRIADAATDVVELADPAAAPTPVTGVWPDTDAERETLEGMLYTPAGDFTVTNTYSTNQYGEVGLAKGDRPLIIPTEVADAQDAPAIAAVVADNAARAIVLDDASTKNYTSSSNQDETPPYVSNTKPVRVGAAATFTDDVIFTEGGSSSAPTYRFQPLVTVTGPDFADSPATFENDRTAAPDETLLNEAGEADLKVASFNVLNYFTTLGDADDDNVGEDGCLAYTDRDGDGNNIRPSCDQRGAWDPQDFARQQEKIVAAINALDADVVGLMEIENSAALGETADEATNALVAALNAAAGAQVWAANPSSAELPPVTEQDFITNAIIYKVAAVDRVGPARALGELSGEGEAFANAREPIAQAFVPDAGGETFLVVVNHFKSKSSGVDDGTGQGNANPDRVAQAEALRDWVPSVQTDLGVESTLLIGDFNSYSMEDPLQVLYAAGYTNVEQFSGNDEYSYSFGGQSGSLDHILANAAAMDDYTGVDIWNINAGESVAMEYSRWNYHSTDFHEAGPYRSSDHDPAIMGLDLIDEEPEPEPADSNLKVKATPKKVTEDKTRVKLHVHVKASGEMPTGDVTIVVQDQGTFTGELRNGKFKLRLAKFDTPGTKTVQVTYSGDENVAGDTETITIKVHPAKNKQN